MDLNPGSTNELDIKTCFALVLFYVGTAFYSTILPGYSPYLGLNRPVRFRVKVLEIDIAVHVHLRSVLLHLLAPGPHTLIEGVDILLLTHVDWLLSLAYLADLGTCRHVSTTLFCWFEPVSTYLRPCL